MSFSGQALTPAGGYDTTPHGQHMPAMPAAFVRGGKTFQVLEVLEQWKGIGPADHNPVGKGPTYLQKHWYKLWTDEGTWTVYFERQPRSARQAAQRWWLYSVE